MKDQQKKIRSSLSTRILSDFYSEHDYIIKEGLIALLICATGDLIAGIILGKMTFFLETFPGLLVVIPGAIGMRGNIFGSFASRLSTSLHIGLISPEFEFSDDLNYNIFSSFVLTLVLSIFLAIVAKAFCILLNYQSISLMDFILICTFAGIISNLIMLPITMFVSFKSFEHGWDPDNITSPIIAAFGDLFTLPAIIASIFILKAMNVNILVKYSILVVIIIAVFAGFVYCYRLSDETKTILKQSTPTLLLCSFLGGSAGGILNSSVETLLTNPSLLTLLPLFSGECGSLISILGARLSSALHSGLVEPLSRPKGEALHNFAICFILAIVVFPFIGIIAESSSIAFGVLGVGFDKIIEISTLSGLILVTIMVFLVYYISITSYNHNLDPDNIVIPVSTSVTDSISSLTLISVSLLILGVLI
ncbi:divalent cation transporter [Methanobrevibacter sp. YE315]|uniref:magnesium transporter n=1 Tax=Methanobrevibacter sp. YE315 TaxID=1609968 RepID=UPI000764E571|nr:magnesium transporter [Methanobrevibacter sp. YE315]AMD16590.1 divalent cation transporter [Methanobrevibacter sp. YE315]